MKHDNNYQMYRTVKEINEYFNSWSGDNLSQLNDELKAKIYERYVLKCFVFQRDGFKCVNQGCKNTGSPLTMHHVKFQKNNGKDSARNCVTLCRSCHNGYHRGKYELTFGGATYKVHKEDEVNWKIVKKNNKKFRKKLFKEEGININISQELFAQLIRFLIINLEEEMEDD